ncbi:DEAD/DEAH box helicase [Legionella yabuuchiae]|uniref:DEAD/DEAH box helicase n=1 Tax=Legionella yabuuchiae TaxID=376727 RepID=UPI00105651A3|nr:DEAD/DEAH box helicase family protein [Legionella yabuuchiae]
MVNDVKTISSRLSLRQPQHESLKILAQVINEVTLSKNADIKQSLKAIHHLYPSVEDFERNFPSICFALATGVGKTRLMGAFISYLYLTHKSRNFFILAPNLTIYEKLKEDFSLKSPKYVFKGISEFVFSQPVIVTGEDYKNKGFRLEENKIQRTLFEDDDVPFIYIFNISKINATENKPGATKSKTPRIKRLQETLGESFFDYLASLPDLVLLMDEAHRYRATAGANAINDLKPILGIELTATPKTIGSTSSNFKNIVYSYSLAEAMDDGYVKDPAVATRKDFKPENYTPEQLEKIKLEDGIHHHEYVKVELLNYAKQFNKKIVKPFVLVVAQDTEHARTLREFIESESFFNGNYKGKVAEIHSKQSGAEEDKNIQKLIAIEDSNDPTEIVIHVNKLKEGWDVTNLYTIVPLRASASEILTEQTIGRGLRLPFGNRTGIDALDRLTIVAHDKFQEIIDQANSPDSIIKKKVEIGNDADIPFEKPQNIVIPSLATVSLTHDIFEKDQEYEGDNLIKTSQQYRILDITLDIVKRYERLKSSKELLDISIQEQITKEVQEITIHNEEISNNEVKKIVEVLTKNIAEYTIDIPNIVLIPTRNISYGFANFDLEGIERINYQPVSQEILMKYLRTNKSSILARDDAVNEKEPLLENYIVRVLIDNDLIDYDEHADLLYKLAGQVVSRLKSYLKDESDIENVLKYHQEKICNFIMTQLMQHYWETPTDYQVNVNRGFTILKPFNCVIQQGQQPRDFRYIPEVKSDVKKIIFNGFKKCCYPIQKFDSVDGELRFSQILEDDKNVVRWMKPAPGFFQIEYKSGESYEPDFVVETYDEKYICEPKMASEMDNPIVLAKKAATMRWCEYATKHAYENGGKPWYYLLIPHNAITSERSFNGLVKEFKE